MARKLKIMENEKHQLDLKNDKITEIVKNEKIIEYGEETENGVYQISKDKSESIENFKRDIEQVLNSEVTININLLKPDEVFDQGLSSEYLMGLYPIIGE